jgi:hypothetical protein
VIASNFTAFAAAISGPLNASGAISVNGGMK